MKFQLLQQMIGVILVAGILTGCIAPIVTPIAQTPTATMTAETETPAPVQPVATLVGNTTPTTIPTPAPASSTSATTPDLTLGNIEGTITNKGVPVTKTDITLIAGGEERKTQTDEKGRFFFEKVPQDGGILIVPVVVEDKKCEFADSDFDVKSGETTTKDYDVDQVPEGALLFCFE